MHAISERPTRSARALLEQLIDYAGLFPPASLSLEEAVPNFAAYRRHPDHWMLGRFIVPAARLDEMSRVVEPYLDEALPFRIAALGRGGGDVFTFVEGFQEDLDAIIAFRKRHGASVAVETFETRVPPGVVPFLLSRMAWGLRGIRLRPFFEATTGRDWQGAITTFVDLLTKCNEDEEKMQAGLKLRCGGVTAYAFPTVEQVAFAIATCRDQVVPLKATAGLHHPIRHFAPAVGTKMHGFLNLFGAAILAHVHDLSPEQIAPILADEQPANFRFTDEAFTWQHLAATPDQLRAGRAQALLSYGSCSFDEPREDLRALGVLGNE